VCPKCRFPLSREESRSGTCPFCGEGLVAAGAERPRGPDLPLPVDERGVRLPASEAAGPFLRGALILLVLAVGGGGLYYGVSTGVTRFLGGTDARPPAASPGPDKRPADASVAEAPGKAAPPAAPAPSQAAPPAAPAIAASAASGAANGGTPPAAPESPPAEARSEPLPAASHEIVGGGKVRRIDKPDGEYVVEPLDGAANVFLRGKVKTLRIGSLDGDAVLDASGLEAQEVCFTGPVGGNARARVCAPNGAVEVRAPVGGRANLTIDAAGGRVTFPRAEAGGAGAEIGGDPRMKIKAREVDFEVPINGGAQVHVVLSAGAKIRFTELSGSTRLTWQKAGAGDPDPEIGWGIMRDGARFREAK
jgi:hypothetical protein